jgi:hypothetical protein
MKTPSAKERPAARLIANRASRPKGPVQPNRCGNQIEAIRSLLNRATAQPKAVVNPPGDPFEREADAVADRVVAGRPAPSISRLPAGGISGPAKGKPVEELDERIQRQSMDEEEELLQAKRIQRQPEEEEEEIIRDRRIQRQAEEEEEEPLQTKAIQRRTEKEEEEILQASGAAPSRSAIADGAIDAKEGGKPLTPDTRSRLEAGMGVDLSHVRVHDGNLAHHAARALNARAFTHRNDIWLGSGETQADTRLMAHEATHVVQQQAGLVQRVVQRSKGAATTAGEGGAALEETARRDLETFRLPPIKVRHRSAYEAWAAGGRLKRTANYTRGNPDQKNGVWIPNVTLPQDKLRRIDMDAAFTGTKTIGVNGHEVSGTYRKIRDTLKVPHWDRRGRVYPQPFEVDHIVELQVGSWTGSGPANTLTNMELLDKSSNASAGGSTRASIRQNVRNYLRATGRTGDANAVDQYLASNDITFHRVKVRKRGRRDGRSQHWTRAEIESGAHMDAVRPLRNVGEAGSADAFALVSPSRLSVLGEFRHPANRRTIHIRNRVDQKRVAGLTLTLMVLKENYTSLQEIPENAQMGTAHGTWDLPKGVTAPAEEMALPLMRHSQYAGYLGPLPSLTPDFEPMSLLQFGQVAIEGNAITATGWLTPSIPMLGGVPIEVSLRGRQLAFAYFYRPEELTLPIPGLTIEDVGLGVFYGTQGFGVQGGVDLGIHNMGTGRLEGRVDNESNLELAGSFNFDTRLFDRAEIAIWYRNRAFGGQGTLAIESPGKVTGIRSANISATFAEDRFSAAGTIKPDIPGIQQASLNMAYNEEAGLTIGGSLQLANNIPGIRSGSIEAQVRKRPDADEYEVFATGTAQPDIPGLDTSLIVAYENGLITAEGRADYNRGMLSGFVEIGVTNRAVDRQGQPTGDIGRTLRVYGGGSVTLRIAPWMAATAGVRILKNGEIELAGSIGLPDVLEVFPEKRHDKKISSIKLDIPIIGFTVAGQRIGIFASIGGGLNLSAAIGPGQLRELKLSITYNPDREDRTRVKGGARLVIPAQAGLRLFVHGSVGAGIPIVSADVGLEAGGRLGLEGAVETDIRVAWTPVRGLVLDTAGELYGQPKFRFDLTAFVVVTLDLLITDITLYEKRWELAAFESGANLRFGVRFPIHYEEGRPFDISWNEVRFEVPDVDTEKLLGDLVDHVIGGNHHEKVSEKEPTRQADVGTCE